MTNSEYEYLSMNNFQFPVRGYTIGQKYGTKAMLVNLELRLPFLIYYFPTIQYLGQIFGVIFVDMGVAWDEKFPKFNDESSWEPLDGSCYNDDNIYIKDCGSGWLMSYGIGPRFILFGMPWKLDFAWQYDPDNGKKSDSKWYLSIGLDF